MRYIKTAAILIIILSFMIVPSKVPSADISTAAQSEIAHLFAYIDKSGCHLYRNGTWYQDVKGPREHVEMKYRYFMEKGLINSAEDFIERAATKSEISGKPYLVRCNNGPEMPTSQWLFDELSRYRKEKPVSR